MVALTSRLSEIGADAKYRGERGIGAPSVRNQGQSRMAGLAGREKERAPLTSTKRGRVPVTVVLTAVACHVPRIVRLAIGTRLPRGSRSHRATLVMTEEEILNSARGH